MFVLVTGRRQGKTHAIVNWYLERPYERYILVGDQYRKKHVINMIGQRTRYMLDLARVRSNIVTVEDLPGGRLISYGRSLKEFPIAIDDADWVLERLLGSPVEFLTLNATLIAPATSSSDYIDGDIVDWDDCLAIEPRRRMLKEST